MIRPGDVVWADGRSWVANHGITDPSQLVWVAMSDPMEALDFEVIAKQQDFRWLVKSGLSVV